MHMFFKLAIASLLLCFASVSAAGADRGTPDEAVAMVRKVIDDMKKVGKEKVIQDVQAGSARYKDRDLYVFISGMDGITRANGANPKIAGKDLNDIKDADGKPIGKERFELARTKGKGWQEYRWPDPLTKQSRMKSTYLEKYEDMVVSCGVYKD